MYIYSHTERDVSSDFNIKLNKKYLAIQIKDDI